MERTTTESHAAEPPAPVGRIRQRLTRRLPRRLAALTGLAFPPRTGAAE
ncbi:MULTISPECIES: hypothetical protein [unclassified Streptomyces]|nr:MULTISPECIES: hypothetical protein [unclassified Streptomyces]WSR23942.1 hypothetical protein OG573_36025 [Streptomyces sp. NBC_01205]